LLLHWDHQLLYVDSYHDEITMRCHQQSIEKEPTQTKKNSFQQQKNAQPPIEMMYQLRIIERTKRELHVVIVGESRQQSLHNGWRHTPLDIGHAKLVDLLRQQLCEHRGTRHNVVERRVAQKQLPEEIGANRPAIESCVVAATLPGLAAVALAGDVAACRCKRAVVPRFVAMFFTTIVCCCCCCCCC
jgi:hypothetical protein